VIDANGLALAHVYGQPPDAIAFSDKRLTDDEAEKIARLIARLPELVELEKDRNKARSRRKPQPLHLKPVTVGDLIREGKLLKVHCGNCRPARHLYIDAGSLDLPKRLPVPQICSRLMPKIRQCTDHIPQPASQTRASALAVNALLSASIGSRYWNLGASPARQRSRRRGKRQ
jgi:hypothetical protein